MNESLCDFLGFIVNIFLKKRRNIIMTKIYLHNIGNFPQRSILKINVQVPFKILHLKKWHICAIGLSSF